MTQSLLRADLEPPVEPRKPFEWIHRSTAPTIRYWFSLDSHVYAMAIGANVLFGFFPFMFLILTISEQLFPWSEADRAIYIGLRAFLPEDAGLVDFVLRNLRVAVEQRGKGIEIVSIVLLILASNGIFQPLEVAQNRLWGFKAHRNYWFNQLISFCLTAIVMVTAISVSLFAVTAAPVVQDFAGSVIVDHDKAILAALKMAEAPSLLLVFTLVYWALPNGKVPFWRAFGVAFVVMAAVEGGMLAYSWIWPWLDLRTEYGPFFISVTLVLWGFLSAMVALAGAEVVSRPGRKRTGLSVGM